MSAVLRVDNARKSYGDQVALEGAELSLERGEWLGLLGPNGAGKTTLVRAISGRVALDSGSIDLFGSELTPGPGHPARRRLGVVPQEIALYPLLTARENLEAFAALNGLDRKRTAARVAATLDWTGLSDRASEPVKGFSGGMKRRLNIAASVLHEPEVLLLDEPTVGVDPQSRERIWEMLDELRRGGTSLLLTTHQLDEAEKVCDRIVILDGGHAIANGTLDELIAGTIGEERRVKIQLRAPLAASLEGVEASDDGLRLRLPVRDVAVELPAALTRVAEAGGTVTDVRVDAPSLHNVFLHLTGRELRE